MFWTNLFALLTAFSLAAFADEATLLWRAKVGCEHWGLDCPIPSFVGTDSTPAIAPDGKVFIGSYTGVLHEVDPQTGVIIKRWSSSSNGEAAVYYSASQNVVISPAGKIPTSLQFVNRTDGAILGSWSFCTSVFKKVMMSCSIASAGAIDDKSGLVFAGGLDSNFYAIDIATRRTKWSYSAGGEIWSTLGPLGLKDAVCFGVGGSPDPSANCNAEIHCLSKDDGSLIWKQRTGIQIQSRPAYGNTTNSIFVGDYDNCLYAFDADSGTHRWRACTSGRVEGSPAVWLSKIDHATPKELVVVGSGDGNVYCFDALSGDIAWSTKITNAVETKFGMDVKNGGVFASPLIVKDGHGGAVVYIGAQGTGGFFAIDALTGKVLWSWSDAERPNAPFGAAAAISADTGALYVATEAGYLYGLQISSTSSLQPPTGGYGVASSIYT